MLAAYSLEVGMVNRSSVCGHHFSPSPTGSLLVCVCMSGLAFMETMNNVIITVSQTPLL